MRVQQDPDLSTSALAAAAWLAGFARRRREQGNTYVMGRGDLMRDLGVSEATAKRARRELEEGGWLLRCGGVGRGRPQRWHRSTPWDPVLYWGLTPCPRCFHGGPRPKEKGVSETRALTRALTPFRAQSEASSWYMALDLGSRPQTDPEGWAPVRVLHIADPALGNVRGRLAPLVRVA